MISRFRAWLGKIPIDDPVNRQMAALLQVVLLGILGIFILSVVLSPFLPAQSPPILALVIRLLITLFIFGIPLFLLRRGWYHTSVLIILALLILFIAYAVFGSRLRDIAETLTFFTLAILLAGLLVGRNVMIATFLISTAAVLTRAFQEQDAVLRSDEVTIALNFILLNGLMSVFVNHFGTTLRNSLRSSIQREAELKQEIIHRKQMEEQINVLNMKLQQQVSELERFTYTVSHDLRNPLVTIKGFLGVLEKDLKDQKMDRIQSDFQRISKATDKMNTLLSELLELSRVGRIANPPEEIDTNQLIQDAIESLHARIRSSNTAILVAPGMPKLYGDHIRLREVFENLIDNAVKYMGDQTDPKIEIGVRDLTGESILYIKDNGMGIEEQYKEKIFGLFEKLNPTIEGTGVGLALVKRIIETHGGKIWVESDGLGKGSTFCFTIPDDRRSTNLSPHT